jgi:hypothetical protein
MCNCKWHHSFEFIQSHFSVCSLSWWSWFIRWQNTHSFITLWPLWQWATGSLLSFFFHCAKNWSFFDYWLSEDFSLFNVSSNKSMWADLHRLTCHIGFQKAVDNDFCQSWFGSNVIDNIGYSLWCIPRSIPDFCSRLPSTFWSETIAHRASLRFTGWVPANSAIRLRPTLPFRVHSWPFRSWKTGDCALQVKIRPNSFGGLLTISNMVWRPFHVSNVE